MSEPLEVGRSGGWTVYVDDACCVLLASPLGEPQTVTNVEGLAQALLHGRTIATASWEMATERSRRAADA